MKLVQLLFAVLLIGSAWITLTVSPPGQLGPYVNGIFSPNTPGFSGSWTLGTLPLSAEIPSPLKIIPFDGTSDMLVLSKAGEVYRVAKDGTGVLSVLDFRDRSFNLADAGASGFALHPDFANSNIPDKKFIFVYYRYKPDVREWDDKGYNRLSRFTWNTDLGKFDLASELILIQQYDRGVWHNGGGMFFHPSDGFLYLSVGDEGMDEHQEVSTQRLDGGFFNGVLRIDVDNDANRSHPIRRQPTGNKQPPNSWPETYSQGYSIPNDNPWLSTSGDLLEEFYSLGVRSPYAMHVDEVTGKVWLADVGSNIREEINIIRKADNHQWPFIEGVVPSEVHSRPSPVIGTERGPFFEYERSVGTCIIGGGVYHGDLFPRLKDQYLFADYTQNKVMAISSITGGISDELSVLISDIGAQPVALPLDGKVAAVSIMPDGNVYLSMIGDKPDIPGKILRLEQKTFVADPPAKLSDLGVFTDLTSLEVIPGIVPYTVNSPLWSDGAEKQRWIAVPNDGVFDEPSEQIEFSKEHDWVFPEGTVFIKHFELPNDVAGQGDLVRVETRFFVVGAEREAYGLTYKWNDEGTEAFLLEDGDTRDIPISDNGNFLYSQRWEYPSRDQCMSCHNSNAKHVLGVKTHQLNGDLFYPHLGRTMNQLTFMNESGMFKNPQPSITSNIKSYPIADESATLETKIRSYLDANCSSCHREGGIPDVFLDFRYNNSQNVKNYVNFPTHSHASTAGTKVIVAGSHQESEIWVRDASEGDDKMPPLGRNFVDEEYVDALAVWIDGLEEAAIPDHDVIVFPNPSPGWLGVRIAEDWQGPFDVTVHSISGHLAVQTTRAEQFFYLDLQGYGAGTYVLTIAAGERRERSKFVIY